VSDGPPSCRVMLLPVLLNNFKDPGAVARCIHEGPQWPHKAQAGTRAVPAARWPWKLATREVRCLDGPGGRPTAPADGDSSGGGGGGE
jgi:hypothetical protein